MRSRSGPPIFPKCHLIWIGRKMINRIRFNTSGNATDCCPIKIKSEDRSQLMQSCQTNLLKALHKGWKQQSKTSVLNSVISSKKEPLSGPLISTESPIMAERSMEWCAPKAASDPSFSRIKTGKHCRSEYRRLPDGSKAAGDRANRSQRGFSRPGDPNNKCCTSGNSDLNPSNSFLLTSD